MQNRKEADGDKEAKTQEAHDWLEKFERLIDNADFRDFLSLLNGEILTVEGHMTVCIDSTALMRMQGEKNGLKRARGLAKRTVDELRKRIDGLESKDVKSERGEGMGGY